MFKPDAADVFLALRHSEHTVVSWQEELGLSYESLLTKDHQYTLFRQEDWLMWVTFSAVFFALLIFDNVILHRNPAAMTITKAMLYTLFWIFCAVGFFAYIWWWKDQAHAWMWMSGYVLEWMLSFDNLFVFHLIFNVYETPDVLKHRPLYYGIMGAVIFRLIFIFVGEYLMHAMFFMHFIFGAFLVYTGIKTATTDDEDEDPSQQPLVQFLQRRVPFISAYDANGAFFVKVALDRNGEAIMPAHCSTVASESGRKNSSKVSKYGNFDVDSYTAHATANMKADKVKMQTRATMLFLVVCCLEISDVLFAVDSVSAIVAQVPDLFLAYTSAVFAMLGLRATFFIIDVLAKIFTLLKYGVAAVLVFIGVKLIVSKVYHIPAWIVCCVLFGSIFLSIVASIIKEKYFPSEEDEDDGSSEALRSPASSISGASHHYGTPLSTPMPTHARPTRVR